MKKQPNNLTDAALLRKKAEDHLKKLAPKKDSFLSEAEMLKLIHELEVHQIELEMQNLELLAAKESAERLEEKFEELYDFAPTGYLTLSKKGEITALNFAAAKMLGKERSLLINKSFALFTCAESKLIFNGFLERAFMSKNVETCEVTLEMNTPSPIYASLSGICDENGEFCRLIASDITDRKHMEEALRESESRLRELNAQKDKFFSIIAHDLRSPFNAIIGLSDVLIDQVNDKDYEKIDLIASMIGQSSRRAMDLLMNLLQWSVLQTGRMEFNPETFNLKHLIEDNKDLLNVVANQKTITIDIVTPTEIMVHADKSMINTVLRNLISNAIKFTGQGGKIIISAKKKANKILVSVSDNGVGIQTERLEQLFRIDQSDSTPGTNNEKGTGLGLILCKEFVEKHGQKIWVESEIGKGTTFYFTKAATAEAV